MTDVQGFMVEQVENPDALVEYNSHCSHQHGGRSTHIGEPPLVLEDVFTLLKPRPSDVSEEDTAVPTRIHNPREAVSAGDACF